MYVCCITGDLIHPVHYENNMDYTLWSYFVTHQFVEVPKSPYVMLMDILTRSISTYIRTRIIRLTFWVKFFTQKPILQQEEINLFPFNFPDVISSRIRLFNLFFIEGHGLAMYKNFAFIYFCINIIS